jgi:hypothetical protein
MSGRLIQEVHFVNPLPTGAAMDDLYEGGFSSDIVNLGKYERATWVIARGVGNTGTAVITVDSCDTVAPGTATAIPFVYKVAASGDTFSATTAATAAGYTTAAGPGSMVVVEVNAAELSGTDKFARLTVTEGTDSAVSGSVVCIMSGGKIVQDIAPTAIV